MINVVNKKNYSGKDAVYIGRPSPLGNPFTHLSTSTRAKFKVATREEAVEKYRGWLQKALKEDEEVRGAFENLVRFYRDFGHLTLVCHCAPKRCHGEILREMILKAAESGGDE